MPGKETLSADRALDVGEVSEDVASALIARNAPLILLTAHSGENRNLGRRRVNGADPGHFARSHSRPMPANRVSHWLPAWVPAFAGMSGKAWGWSIRARPAAPAPRSRRRGRPRWRRQ